MATIRMTWTPGRRKRARIAAIFCATIVLFLVLNQIPFVARATHGVQAFLFSAGSWLGQSIDRITTSKEQVIEERDYYQSLAGTLSVDQAELQKYKNDVEELQMQLAYKESVPFHVTAARIIARSEKGENTLLIDKGSDDGIRNGLAVTVEDGHLIGSVLETHPHSSTIMLVEHPESSVPAMMLGTEQTIGIVEGQEGFLLHMDFIPQDTEITTSSVIVTSGLDSVFPPGLILGVVDSVVKEETAPFQEAFIRPIFDSESFTNVLIIDPFESDL